MADELALPRLVVAGLRSGTGKTTIALGLAAALRRRGIVVQTYKVGLDTRDGGYLAHVSGRPCRNLDPWILGAAGVRDSLVRGADGADVAVVEGGAGLFDAHGPTADAGDHPFPGSTAEVAALTESPVILVLDVAGMGESTAAVALGLRNLDPGLRVIGGVLNGVVSERHRRVVEDAVWRHARLPVLGALPRLEEVQIPEWGHGLLPVADNPDVDRVIDDLATAVERHCDLDLTLRLMRGAPPLPVPLPPMVLLRGVPSTEPPAGGHRPLRLAVAFDEAFCAYYPENLELLAAAGAEIVPFSPLEEAALPSPVDGVYLGGGCVEAHAERLARNRALAAALRRAHQHGVPMYVEGGGVLYAARSLRLHDGTTHLMAGLLPIDLSAHSIHGGPSYREVRLRADCLLGATGTRLRGHEYAATQESSPGLPDPLFTMHDCDGTPVGVEGWVDGTLVASLVQLHFGQDPVIAGRLVAWLRATTGSLREGAGVGV